MVECHSDTRLLIPLKTISVSKQFNFITSSIGVAIMCCVLDMYLSL